jgi:hypothetical protein
MNHINLDRIQWLIVTSQRNENEARKSRLKALRAQPVDATPSDINLFSKGGVHDASETGEAFRDAEDRHVGPLEGGTVSASDWARLRQEQFVHSLFVVAARRDCSGRPSALAGNAHTGGARGHLSRNRLRFVD